MQKILGLGFILYFGLLTITFATENVLRIATTTSTENSGLLEVLNPIFAQQVQARLEVIAVGTGKALKLAENGDVDVVFVHAPAAEIAFVKDGFGVNRQAVMHNDFVILGAKADIAGLKQAQTMSDALIKLHQSKAEFVSRGDDSGTHKKELYLWNSAKIQPQGLHYIRAGQGMGAVLTMTNEKQAYTLSDRGTYLAYKDKLDLEVVFAGSKKLFNPYHIMAVNPAKHPHVNYALAKQYIAFITSATGQKIIANYKRAGEQLFYPDVITTFSEE